MVLFLIPCLIASIVEEETAIGLDSNFEGQNVTFHNTVKRKNGIEMRSSADGGSFITFSTINTHDDWSFMMEFEAPHLHYPESAGIFLWYTEGEPEKGNFNGVDGKFKGMMAGLEVLGKYVELTLGANDGELDAKEFEDVVMMKDSLDPKRFDGISHFKLKVISTSKNFKMEIYDGEDNLLYDNLRYLTATALGDLKAGKHFTITTSYEKVPTYKTFTLKSAQLFSRTEDNDYDPMLIKSQKPKREMRLFDSVSHYNKQAQHLISSIEHLVYYMKNVIGDPTGMSLLKGMGKFSKAIWAYESQLEKIVKNVEDDIEPPQIIEQIRNKIDITEKNIADLEMSVSILHSIVGDIQKSSSTTLITSVYIVGIGFTCVMLTSLLKSLLYKNVKINK